MNKIVIVGSGPNALTAAIILSNSGYKVRIYESYERVGGGLRSYYNDNYRTIHDVCSAVHPLAVVSPVFRKLGLNREVPMVYPEIPFSHAFSQEESKSLSTIHKKISYFSGVAAHSMTDFYSPIGVGVGLSLYSISKIIGWPIPIGGSQKILDFLVSKINFNNTEIFLSDKVDKNNYVEKFYGASGVIWDTTPDVPLSIIHPDIRFKRKYKTGAIKIDYITSIPIPWLEPKHKKSGTIHLGGSYKKIINSQNEIKKGIIPSEPFIILSQPSIFDSTRAPADLHTVWAYAHVPVGTQNIDVEDYCTSVIETYAPGFKDSIVSSNSFDTKDIEKYNPNYVGGDILSGSTNGFQMFKSGGSMTNPWSLPMENWFVCSSAVFPGPGVHGLGGALVARNIIKKI